LHISHNVNYDDTTIPENYNRARDHGPAFLAQWKNIVASRVDGVPIERILDLGCGTGRFSQGLADRLTADVVGVDPSRKMLHEAMTNRSMANVCYVSGAAEAIPLANHSIDLIFISMAFHHFKNPPAVAHECHRVLRNTGRLCLRTGSSEKIAEYPYMPFFQKPGPCSPNISLRSRFREGSLRMVGLKPSLLKLLSRKSRPIMQSTLTRSR
jgi:ubiquinone/menaquinone biosynthesis C-methylase UbiE